MDSKGKVWRGSLGAVLAVAVITGCGTVRTVTRTTTVIKTTTTVALPVLGANGYRYGIGWGRVAPTLISNGGDPSGIVKHLRWTSWGRPVAYGVGLTSIFKPGGGYYPRLVAARLRVSDIGECKGRLAYLRLDAREPTRPGGPLGRWTPWANGGVCINQTSSATVTKTITVTATVTARTPPPSNPKPLIDSGNGTEEISLRIGTPSTIEWTNSGSFFDMSGLDQGGTTAIAISSTASSGVSAVAPGTYPTVTISTDGDWTIKIVADS